MNVNLIQPKLFLKPSCYSNYPKNEICTSRHYNKRKNLPMGDI